MKYIKNFLELTEYENFLESKDYVTPNLYFVEEVNGLTITPAIYNVIYYTSSDGNVITPNKTDVFGANIISNVYENGKGIITFDGDVTSIGDFAFTRCSSLTSVTIPDSVTTIGDNAFYGCSSLTNVTIGDNVITIGNDVFYGCSNLTSVTIPDGVTIIGWSAFARCSSLTSVTIGDSVTTIGDYAFRECSSLSKFNGKYASDDGRCLIIDGTLNSFAPAGLTEYTIPDSVTAIGSSAFYYCSSLKSVTIPDSVTTIGDNAFRYCSSLTSVTIPDSVTTIGGFAFEDCSSLASATIGDSVTVIGERAFAYCSSLTSVYCKAATPSTGGFWMFYNNASDRKIYVPMESVEAYKSAEYWSDYASYIEGYIYNENIETYTMLSYIECNGQQYINTNYVVQEDDVIEMYYITTSTTSADKAMFGVAQNGIGIWATIYSNTSYVRFGSTASVTVSNARMRYKLTLKKGSVIIDDSSASPVYASMPTIPLYVFASNNNNNTVNMYGYCRSMGFKISKENGNVIMDLKPCKRDSDGKIGMLDIISRNFFVSETDTDFIAGSELQMGSNYEAIDYVTFNADKLFDAGIIKSTYKIETLFERTETSKTPYLYGVITSPHTASVTAYLTSSGSWRWGSQYRGFTSNTTKMYKVEISNGTFVGDFTSASFTKSSDFSTPDTLVVGGSRAASGSLNKGYRGYIYYFRILNGSNPILDWYPCKRKSDGVEGFWDCVTQSFVSPIDETMLYNTMNEDYYDETNEIISPTIEY